MTINREPTVTVLFVGTDSKPWEQADPQRFSTVKELVEKTGGKFHYLVKQTDSLEELKHQYLELEDLLTNHCHPFDCYDFVEDSANLQLTELQQFHINAIKDLVWRMREGFSCYRDTKDQDFPENFFEAINVSLYIVEAKKLSISELSTAQ